MAFSVELSIISKGQLVRLRLVKQANLFSPVAAPAVPDKEFIFVQA